MHESVSIVIFDEKKNAILLLKRRDIPVWVLPGGGIDPEEAPDQAALREAEEETGLKLSLVRKVAYYTPTNKLTRPTHLFECQVVSGEPKTGSETREIRFFPLNDLPKRLVPFYRTWIEDALKFSTEVIRAKIKKTSYWKLLQYALTHPLLVFQFFLTRMGIHLNR